MSAPEDTWLDGNGMAGLLTEVFGAEVTAVVRGCGSCGANAAIGAHRAYRGAGVVLRCPACGDVAISIAQLPDRNVVLVRGAWAMELPQG